MNDLIKEITATFHSDILHAMTLAPEAVRPKDSDVRIARPRLADLSKGHFPKIYITFVSINLREGEGTLAERQYTLSIAVDLFDITEAGVPPLLPHIADVIEDNPRRHPRTAGELDTSTVWAVDTQFVRADNAPFDEKMEKVALEVLFAVIVQTDQFKLPE